MDIKELKTHFDGAMTEMKDLVTRQSEELKTHGQASEETGAAIAKLDTTISDLSQSLKEADDRLTEAETKLNRPGQGGSAQQVKTLGQSYIESDVFKSQAESKNATGANVFQEKAITSGPASAGALTDQFRRQDIFANPNRPNRIRDLVQTLPTSEAAVEVMRELVFTNSAAPQSAELAAKAESDITFELVTLAVKTIAHWLPASRQILSDAPRLRAFIDGRLSYGLDLESDNQLLYGSGVGQNVLGLMVDSGVQNIGASAGTTGADYITHVRKAVTALQGQNYYNPNAVVLNPLNWEEIELAKGSDGHYIWVTVPNGGEQRLWRVPVVVSNAINDNDFLMGDFFMGATIYDREMKSVRASESHANYFVENGVAILAEERYAFGAELPAAFAKGTFAIV